ncbi:MAG: hypothetical protein ACMUEL_07780 [Flavobacteriales bacterium Tduv]
MILAVHSLAANEHDSRGAKAINKKSRMINPEKYMETKVTKCQPTCSTFIVEASKTVYKRNPIGTFP